MILTFIKLEFLNCTFEIRNTFEIECKTKIVIMVKFKKALAYIMGFLDYGTVHKSQAACKPFILVDSVSLRFYR